MKKVFCFVLALLVCASLAFPVLAAEGFVPSITYKGGPLLIEAIDGTGEDILGCLEVIPVSKAKDMETEEAKLLIKLYEELSKGVAKLPYDNTDDIVIRELVTVVAVCEHEHSGKFTLTMDLGVGANAVVSVMGYNGEWVSAEEIVNNGDGTVSFVLENLGPVAVAVEA